MPDASSEAALPRRRPGRPSAFDAEGLRTIERIAREHGNDTLRELRNRVAEATGRYVSLETLRARLRGLGFVRVVPPRGKKAADEDVTTASGQATDETPATSRYGYDDPHREKGPEAPYMHALGDAEWAIIADLFEDPVRGVARKYSRRSMVDAIAYVMRGGIPWRMMPHDFPPWLLVFKTFRRWSRQGRFEKMHDRLRRMWREREGRAPEPTAAVIDSQSVKTSPQGGPKGYDGAKKVKGRKRHLMTDVLGLLLAVCVQVASTQDRDGADEVAAAGLAKAPTVKAILADAAYGGECQERLEAAHPGVKVEIARHPGNRAVGTRTQNPGQQQFEFLAKIARTFVPLPKRWVIERTNAWVDRPRRLAKDQERTIESSTAWIWFAEARRLLRRLVFGPGPAHLAAPA